MGRTLPRRKGPNLAIATAERLSSETVYLTPAQVCEIVPGMTKPTLAQLRFKGTGPQYFKPTPRVVLYAREDIENWVRSSVRTSTANA